MATLQLRLWFQRNAPLKAARELPRLPPVRRAWEPAPERVSRAGSAIAASPPYSEITTLLAMSSAVSSNGVRTTLAPRVRSRPTLPEIPPPALHSVFFGG